MKHLQFGLLILFLFYFPGLRAQQNHFIYIQTENKQPFYVKLDKKLYSSSASGYLVVPKLKDGTYNLAIGFPKSEWPEQNIHCIIENTDIGYLLKNFDNKGWGLFNLQTLAVIMPTEGAKVTHVEVINNTDAFSNMLSTVLNDSTIRQTEVVKEEAKKAEEQKPMSAAAKENVPVPGEQAIELPAGNEAKNNVSKTLIPDPGLTAAVVQSVLVKQPEIGSPAKGSGITRSSFIKNADGTEMVFTDESNGQKDTIRIFIPVGKNSGADLGEKAKETEKTVEIEKPKEEPMPGIAKQEVNAKNNRFLEIEVPNLDKRPEENKPGEVGVTENKAIENKATENKATENKATENKATENKASEKKDTPEVVAVDTAENHVEPVIHKTPMINSDCKSIATDEDFLKLRKKMAAEDNEDDMVTLAKKLLKTKCFTVEQVKNLSVLFLKDSGKYAFFDMAYPFVSDSHNFSSLQNQLSEAYYINRFQSMIRH